MRESHALNATGEAVCMICKNPMPLFSHTTRLYCSSTCKQAARRIQTKEWKECGYCGKNTTHKWCSIQCRDKNYAENRRRQLPRKRVFKRREREVLPLWGVYGFYTTMPSAMPTMWNPLGLF